MKLHFEFTTKIREKLQALIKGFFVAKNKEKGGKMMNWREIFNKAFSIADFVFSFFKFKWWEEFKEQFVEGFQIAVELAELAYKNTQTEGAEKKRLAAKALTKYLQERGILDFIPAHWLSWLLDRAFDLIISYLNEQFGHDWIEKIVAEPSK